MIKHPDSFTKEIREKMRGGDGSVIIEHLWKPGDEMKSHTRMNAKLTLMPGCSIGPHPHNGEEEIFYIVSGTAEVNDDGKNVSVTAGDTILTGGGASHGIRNTGSVPLVIIAFIGTY